MNRIAEQVKAIREAKENYKAQVSIGNQLIPLNVVKYIKWNGWYRAMKKHPDFKELIDLVYNK